MKLSQISRVAHWRLIRAAVSYYSARSVTNCIKALNLPCSRASTILYTGKFIILIVPNAYCNKWRVAVHGRRHKSQGICYAPGFVLHHRPTSSGYENVSLVQVLSTLLVEQ